MQKNVNIFSKIYVVSNQLHFFPFINYKIRNSFYKAPLHVCALIGRKLLVLVNQWHTGMPRGLTDTGQRSSPQPSLYN